MIPSSSASSTSLSFHTAPDQHASEAACFTVQIQPNGGYICPVLHVSDAAQQAPADGRRTRPWCDDESARRLLAAAESGDIEQLWRLQDQGVKINARDGCGYTAFQRALAQGNVAAATLLRKVGAKVDTRDGSWRTPLLAAVEAGCRPAVTALLSWHADPNRASPLDGATPLISAARSGDVGMVEELLRAGAKRNACDKNGDAALHVASSGGVLKALLHKGAEIGLTDHQGKTPLLRAIERGDTEGAQALKENTTEWPLGLLKSMVRSGSPAMLRLVLSWSADLRRQAQSDPLRSELIGLAIQLGHAQVLRAMKEYGIHVAPYAEQLHEAARRGHVEVVRLLLEWDPPRVEQRAGWFSSASVYVPRVLQSSMFDALALAVEHGHCAVVDLLLDERLRLDNDQKLLLLRCANSQRNVKMTELLLTRGVVAYLLLHDVDTPIHGSRLFVAQESESGLPYICLDVTDWTFSFSGTVGIAAAMAIAFHDSHTLQELIHGTPSPDSRNKLAVSLLKPAITDGNPSAVDILLKCLCKHWSPSERQIKTASDPIIATLLQCWPSKQPSYIGDPDFDRTDKLLTVLSELLAQASSPSQIRSDQEAVKDLHRTKLFGLNWKWAQTIIQAHQSILRMPDANESMLRWAWLTNLILVKCLPGPDHESELGASAGKLSPATVAKIREAAAKQYTAMRAHCTNAIEYWFDKCIVTLVLSCLEKTTLSLSVRESLAKELEDETGLLHEPAHMVSLCWKHALRAAMDGGNLNFALTQAPKSLNAIFSLLFASEFSLRYGELLMQSRPDPLDFRGIVTQWQKVMILRHCDAVLVAAASALAAKLAKPGSKQAIGMTQHRKDARS